MLFSLSHSKQAELSVIIRPVITIFYTALVTATAYPAVPAAALKPGNTGESVKLRVGNALPPQKTVKSTANSITGTVAAINSTEATLQIKESGGALVMLGLSDKTLCWRAHRPCGTADFKPGESVTVRVHHYAREDLPRAVSICDPGTSRWLAVLAKTTTQGTIKDLSDGVLALTVGDDEAGYIVTSKTRWLKGRSEAAPEDFKTGDSAFVIASQRTSGALTARAVADSAAGAVLAKERLARSFHATVISVDAAAPSISLQTAAGDTRTLPLSSNVQVTFGTKPALLSALTPKRAVRVDLRKGPSGEDVAAMISIQKTGTARTTSRATFASKSKPTLKTK